MAHDLTVIFGLEVSTHIKASCKMLMKLTPDLNFEAVEVTSEASTVMRLALVMSQKTTRGYFSSLDLTM